MMTPARTHSHAQTQNQTVTRQGIITPDRSRRPDGAVGDRCPDSGPLETYHNVMGGALNKTQRESREPKAKARAAGPATHVT